MKALCLLFLSDGVFYKREEQWYNVAVMWGRAIRHLYREEMMAETMIVALFLAFSGGFQDAYTFIVRDHVFANAQTGNIVLMSTHLMQGDFTGALRYLLPVCAFAGGVLAANFFKSKHRGLIHNTWHQTVVLAEMICLFIVGFMPLQVNILANMIVSFSCAMQVETFRKVNGNPYASTMCIGNLRSCNSNLSQFIQTKDRKYFVNSLDYFLVIAVFAIGAGLGGNLSAEAGIRSVWICLPFLLTAYLLMFMKKGDREK